MFFYNLNMYFFMFSTSQNINLYKRLNLQNYLANFELNKL
jgi:hypothetical protein